MGAERLLIWRGEILIIYERNQDLGTHLTVLFLLNPWLNLGSLSLPLALANPTQLLSRALRLTLRYSEAFTRTQRSNALLWRLAAALITNSIVLPISVSVVRRSSRENFYSPGGLSSQTISLLVCDAFIPTFLYLMNPMRWIRRLAFPSYARTHESLVKMLMPDVSITTGIRHRRSNKVVDLLSQLISGLSKIFNHDCLPCISKSPFRSTFSSPSASPSPYAPLPWASSSSRSTHSAPPSRSCRSWGPY